MVLLLTSLSRPVLLLGDRFESGAMLRIGQFRRIVNRWLRKC